MIFILNLGYINFSLAEIYYLMVLMIFRSMYEYFLIRNIERVY